MVKADGMEHALRVLGFTRFEKVYAAKLRMGVSDRALAKQLGSSVDALRLQLVKARRGAARKVLYRCRRGNKMDEDRFKSLANMATTSSKLARAFREAVPQRGKLSEEQEGVLDRFLMALFKSAQWARTLVWRGAHAAVKQHTRRIRLRHQERYTAGHIQKISWEEVGEGVLNDTSKGSPVWEHWRSVLQRNGNDREKKSLLAMLGSEMELLYSRYRHSLERIDGRTPTYRMFSGEKRHARQVVENCLQRDIHPVELLRYWDGQISSFVDMRYPTLAFLKGSVAIERLAARKEEKVKPKDGNSYSNLNGLHPKFRSQLEEAGFPTQAYPDRMLLSIQYMAVQRARGHKFFVDNEQQRKMIYWSAR